MRGLPANNLEFNMSSYPLIAKATLTIAAADKTETTHAVEVRKYPAPKRDAKGTISVFGADAPYRITSGKNRAGDAVAYLYVTVKGASGFFPIPSARVAALTGATLTLTEVVAAPTEPTTEAATTEAAPEAPPVETAPVETEPATETAPVEPTEPATESRAQRRRREKAAA